eukprot:363803-Chlamydomonas_euryale.AAC.12
MYGGELHAKAVNARSARTRLLSHRGGLTLKCVPALQVSPTTSQMIAVAIKKDTHLLRSTSGPGSSICKAVRQGRFSVSRPQEAKQALHECQGHSNAGGKMQCAKYMRTRPNSHSGPGVSW